MIDPNSRQPPHATELAETCCSICELARAAMAHPDGTSLIGGALQAIHQVLDASLVRLVRAERGAWKTVANVGDRDIVPSDLLASAAVDEVVVHASPWIVTPVRGAGQSVEMLVVATPAANDHVQWTSILGRLLGAVTSIVEMSRRRDQRAKWMDALAHLYEKRNSPVDARSQLAALARKIAALFDIDLAVILLWNRPQHELVPFGSADTDGETEPMPDDVGIVAGVLRTGENRLIGDIGELNDHDRRTWLNGASAASVLCLPVSVGTNQPLGALLLIDKRVDTSFSNMEETATELATSLANQFDIHEHLRAFLGRMTPGPTAAASSGLIGESRPIVRLRDSIRRVAPTDLPVLILGENGSGKEVASRSIHAASPRRNQPLLAVNCAALSETLLESELFGHVAGAFTDATEHREGKFELASGGTLFLDEIAELNVSGQAKLLRVVEEQIVVRVGGWEPIKTDARVIAATNRDLARLVREGKFREDLFYRLNVVVLNIPPLRERTEDILPLARHFLADYCARAERPVIDLTTAAEDKLLSHRWPGNVRQLRNLMERLAFLGTTDTVDVAELAEILKADRAPDDDQSLQSLTTATREFQSDYIQQHIQAARGNMTQAARNLGLQRSNLYRKMRQLDMEAGEE